MDLGFYSASGELTQLTAEQVTLVREFSSSPETVCRAVQGLLVSPGDAFGTGLSEQRMTERNTRPASELLQRAMALDESGIHVARPNDRRVVGTCRHYAVLATAFFRAAGRPARARCGFASYFVPAKYVDHWVTECWSDDEKRWVRVDAEIVGSNIVAQPLDLEVGEFLSGGEAWQQVRAGVLDAMDFGVVGTENWGPGEIRGNLLRDLAALNKVEMLPWDEWGQMAASYNGETDDDFDVLMDKVAAACAGDDFASLQQMYSALPVPNELIC